METENELVLFFTLSNYVHPVRSCASSQSSWVGNLFFLDIFITQKALRVINQLLTSESGNLYLTKSVKRKWRWARVSIQFKTCFFYNNKSYKMAKYIFILNDDINVVPMPKTNAQIKLLFLGYIVWWHLPAFLHGNENYYIQDTSLNI